MSGLRRRPRIVWLTDTPAGSGAATMVRRRIAVLGDGYRHTRVVMRGRPTGPAMLRSGGLAAEAAVARADLLVTTSELTLMSVAPRLLPRTRVLHVLHEPVAAVTARARSMRVVPLATMLVVPGDADPAGVAATVGLDPVRVRAEADFVLDSEVRPSAGGARVVLGVGNGLPGSGLAELVAGFGQVADDLPGWQLRLAGADLGLLDELIDSLALRSRVVPLGARADLAGEYADAGVVARVGTLDAWGLPVLEALAAGVPVLASDTVPAARRHVTDGVGLLIDRAEPGGIAEALRRAVADQDRLAEGARASAPAAVDPTAARRTADLVEAVLGLDAERSHAMLTDLTGEAKESE